MYLESNALVHLPEELFTKLNVLQWLDVRHNRLTTLPSTIKYHSSLETILLQENRIERLPLELGVVPNLEAVQLQGNPLIYPPPDILAQGFKEIIKFLRKQWNVEHPNEAVYIAEGKEFLFYIGIINKLFLLFFYCRDEIEINNI